jgi:hypothetical protein
LRSGERVSSSINSPAEVRAVRSRLRDLVAQELKEDSKDTNASEHSLTNALKALQGGNAPSEIASNTPSAKMFVLGEVRTVAIAYDLLEGGLGTPDNHSYLQFYTHESGEWNLRAQAPTETDFEGHTFFIKPVKAPVKDEMWFLVSGFRFGDTGTRLKIRLYSYNGAGVRTVWQRGNLTAGEVSVSNDVITLEYNRQYHSSDPHNRLHEEFQIVPDGLQCITPECQ